MLVEIFRYYAVVLFWIRVIHMKRSNKITLTENEMRLLSLFEGTSHNISEPLYLYLRGFGATKDQGTGQNLIAVFLDLAETVVNGFDGY